ncbi:hypothetical protein FDF26_15360 [Clostridium botulinum]|nr:hypothetical protein [Clostridium botulinum]
MIDLYVLTIKFYGDDEELENEFDMYFSTNDNAIEFINNNFKYDNPKKITKHHFEGRKNVYCIHDSVIDQMRM